MANNKTGIEWTDRTWNPTTGCDKVSPGCTHCYAEAITKRFTNNVPEGFTLKLHPERCLLYTSPSPRDMWTSRMPSSA